MKMDYFRIKILLSAILFMISGLLNEVVAQQYSDLFRQNLYESFIHATLGENNQLPNNLNTQELRVLSRAHYERAKVLESVYTLTLYSGEQLLSRMAEEMTDFGAQSVIKRLQKRQRAAKFSMVTGAHSDSIIGSLEHYLVNWHIKGMNQQACESATPGCRLISLLHSDDPGNYNESIALLHSLQPGTGQSLLDNLVEAETLERRGEMIVKWINQLHLYAITDYTLAAWLSEIAEYNNESDVYYFHAGNWHRFGEPITRMQNEFDIYRAIGHSMAQREHCSTENMPESVISYMSSNSQRMLLSVEAMARCNSAQLLEENFSGLLRSVEVNNRDQAQSLATALIAIGQYGTALNELSRQVSRNDVYQISRATPYTMSTLAYLRFHANSAENWREARDLIVRLEREFSAVSSSRLILQIATEPEIRQSINVYTD